MNLTLDEGYMFGLGAFETIAVYNRKPILLSYHLERLKIAQDFFNIEKEVTEAIIQDYLKQSNLVDGVLKIMLSKDNLLFTTRKNPYTPADYHKGFAVTISKILRNASSPLTCMKTFNYGDNILEKRLANKNGFDEPVFLNSNRELTEGACTNLFFIKNNHLYTPSKDCGLLPGTLRRYLLENYSITETTIYPEDIASYDEVFLTNALMGIMPVRQFEKIIYEDHPRTNQLLKEYQEQFLT